MNFSSVFVKSLGRAWELKSYESFENDLYIRVQMSLSIIYTDFEAFHIFTVLSLIQRQRAEIHQRSTHNSFSSIQRRWRRSRPTQQQCDSRRKTFFFGLSIFFAFCIENRLIVEQLHVFERRRRVGYKRKCYNSREPDTTSTSSFLSSKKLLAQCQWNSI